MPAQIEIREIEVSHAGTFASEFAPNLQAKLDKQDGTFIQRIFANGDDVTIEKWMGWREVQDAATDALFVALNDPHDDEVTDLPNDRDAVTVRKVDLNVNESGAVVVGVRD